jgi:hypothetical protein
VLLTQGDVLIFGVWRGIFPKFASADFIGVQLGVGSLVFQMLSPLFLLFDFLDYVLGKVGVILFGANKIGRALG